MNQMGFFDFAAEVGLTKHIGGLAATDAIAGLCHIGEGQYVLDVGCGAGVTPCYLAKKYKCRVMGVDILDKMIERCQERARKEILTGQVEFRVADAQNLPFEDNLFDAVITESVTAFPPDKQKAVMEYVRVTKPGGYVGLNESTWLKVPPPPEMVAWVSKDAGASVTPLTSDEWTALLKNAGLKEINSQTFSINIQDESSAIVKRYGFGGMLRILGRMFSLYFKNPSYREFVKGIKKEDITPKNLDEYFGYGLFVAKKPAA